jgi:uncharacterized membrane protein YhaH (DUF805 family)
MQGKILDFSVQTNTGVITGQDNKRYQFSGAEWKEQQVPKRGLQVDFDIDPQGAAVAVYSTLSQAASSDVISQFKEKTEDQYSPFDWFLKGMKNYINFQGRARRKEYWFFVLFNTIGLVIAMVLDAVFGTEVLFYALYILAIALPVLGVSIRRLHDIGRSGWWYLIVCIPIIGFLVLLYWFTQDGEMQANQYGQPSK